MLFASFIATMEPARLIVMLCIIVCIVDGIIYIDRHTLDFDEKLVNMTMTYFPDQKRNSVVNLTIETIKTITKILIYVTLKVPENQNDREYRREVIRTVIDFGKFIENSQSNPVLRAFLDALKKGTQFKISYPMLPVSLMQLDLLLIDRSCSTGHLQVRQHILRCFFVAC